MAQASGAPAVCGSCTLASRPVIGVPTVIMQSLLWRWRREKRWSVRSAAYLFMLRRRRNWPSILRAHVLECTPERGNVVWTQLDIYAQLDDSLTIDEGAVAVEQSYVVAYDRCLPGDGRSNGCSVSRPDGQGKRNRLPRSCRKAYPVSGEEVQSGY